MALFIRQDDERSELQKRISSELQEKARKSAELAEAPDLVEDSQYIKGMKKTTSLAWVWIIIIFIAIGLALWIIATN